jgi:eukaryotic-like serine/threonine-protein kinase
MATLTADPDEAPAPATAATAALRRSPTPTVSSLADGSSDDLFASEADLADEEARRWPSTAPQRHRARRPAAGQATPAAPAAAREAAAPLTRGQRDPARYEVDGEHGRGGLGRVMRAQDRDLGRSVAIKELLRRDPIGEVRFFREAMLTARLEHPGIVPVHEAGRWPDGTPFYTMKLVDGRPLKALLEGAVGYAARLALLPHVAAVADAIAYAHERGIIHRDLKPSNVIVGQFGETVVIDWGLAKEVGSADGEPDGAAGPFRKSGGGDLTATGAVLGTPAYMPLEQASGAEVDERADVYAIGAILYDLLAGRAPYPGAQERALQAILAAPPPPVEELEPQVAPDLAAIVARAMARAAADRYPNARGLAEDLKRFLTGQLVSAHHYGPRQLLRRWAARHRAPLAVAAIAATSLAVGGTLAVQQIIAQRDTAERERDTARHERAAAAAARATAEAKADQMILTTAERYLVEDPTRTLSILSEYPDTGADWARVAQLATDAVSRGVAARVFDTGDTTTTRLRYSVDGAYLAAAGSRTLLVWRTSDWRLVVEDRISGRSADGAPSALAAASSRPLFVSVHTAGEVRVADAVAGTVRRWKAPVELADVTIDDAGQAVTAIGADGALRRWSLTDGSERVIPAHRGAGNELPCSADGRWMLSVGSDGRALVWDASLPDDRPRRVLDLPKVERPIAAISADGSRLAISDAYSAIWVWWRDPSRGRTPLRLTTDGTLYQMAFSADGTQLLASYQGDRVRQWDLATGAGTFHTGGVTMAVGAAGLVATGAGDGSVRLRDLSTDWQRSLLGHRSPIRWMAVAPTGEISSIADGGELRVWSRTTHPVWIRRSPSFAFAGRFLPDSRHLLTASFGGEIELWDVAAGTVVTYPGHAGGDVVRSFAGGGIVAASIGAGGLRIWPPGRAMLDFPAVEATRQIAVVEDGDDVLVLVGTKNGELWRVDVGSGRCELVRRYPSAIVSVAGRTSLPWVAIGSQDGTVDLWDPTQSTFIEQCRLDGLRGLTVLADGSIVALDGKQVLHRGSRSGADRVEATDVPVSSDGARLVAGTSGRWFTSHSDAGEVRIWDDRGHSAPPILTGVGHADAALSEQHSLAIAGGANGVLAVRDLRTGGELELEIGPKIGDVDIAPDGRRISVAAGEILIAWQLDELRPPSDPSALRRWLRARPSPSERETSP